MLEIIEIMTTQAEQLLDELADLRQTMEELVTRTDNFMPPEERGILYAQERKPLGKHRRTGPRTPTARSKSGHRRHSAPVGRRRPKAY